MVLSFSAVFQYLIKATVPILSVRRQENGIGHRQKME